MGIPRSFACSLLTGSNQVEVASDVVVGAGRDLVLMNLILGRRPVLGVDLLVGAAFEAALGRAENGLAPARPLPGVGTHGLDVHRAHLRVLSLAREVGVVPVPPLLALFA